MKRELLFSRRIVENKKNESISWWKSMWKKNKKTESEKISMHFKFEKESGTKQQQARYIRCMYICIYNGGVLKRQKIVDTKLPKDDYEIIEITSKGRHPFLSRRWIIKKNFD